MGRERLWNGRGGRVLLGGVLVVLTSTALLPWMLMTPAVAGPLARGAPPLAAGGAVGPAGLAEAAPLLAPAAAGPSRYQVVETIPLAPGVGLDPLAVAADPTSPLAYVVNQGSRDLTVVSGTQVLGMVPLISDWELSQYPLHAGVDPSSGLLYLLEPVLDRCNPLRMNVWLQVVSATQTIETHLLYQCDMWEDGSFVGCGEHGVAFQPRTGYAYALLWHGDSPLGSPQGEVVVLQAGQVITRVATPGISPRSVAADSQRGWVYVTFRFTDAVTVLSGTAVVGTVPVSDPRRVEVNPSTGLAYVEQGGGGLAVLSGTSRLGEIPLDAVGDMAAHPGNGTLFVSHPERPWVSILSGTEVLTRVNVVAPGQDLQVDSSTGLVYVSHPEAPLVTLISGTAVLSQVAVQGNSGAIGANPASGLVYVVDGERSVSVLQGTVLRTVLPPAFPRPRALAVHPDDGSLYMLGAPPSFSMISGTAVVASIPLTSAPGEMGIMPRNGLIYVTLPEENAVLVFERSSLTARIPLPEPSESPVGLAMQPRTGYVYVLDLAGTVSVLSDTQLVATVPVGSLRHLRTIAANPADGLVYVTDFGRATIAVISRTEILQTIDLDGHPTGISLSPHDGYGYVGGYRFVPGWPHAEGRLWVLSGTEVLTSVHSPLQPKRMAVSPVTGYAYLAMASLSYADPCGEVQVWRGPERLATWGDGQLPGGRARFSAIAVDAGSDHVYLGQASHGGLLSIGRGRSVVQSMAVGDGSKVQAIAVDGSAQRVYVATDHAVTVLEEVEWPHNLHWPWVPVSRP